MPFELFYEYAILATTLIASSIGGWIDLKTTEVPDGVPIFIAFSALLLHIANGIFGSGWETLQWGLGVGLAYLAFGYLLFYSGQWGEADVLLLAAMGFAIPQPLSFVNIASGVSYPLFFLINTFIVGAIYSIVYAIVVAFRVKNFWSLFKNQMIESIHSFKMIGGIFILGVLAILFVFRNVVEINSSFFYSMLVFVPLLTAVFLLYGFARTIDKYAFKKKIKSSELKEGDVLANDIPELKLSGKLFVGLTPEQIKQIRKLRKAVEIKEGIRYVPSFPLALAVTLLFGNILLLLFPILA